MVQGIVSKVMNKKIQIINTDYFSYMVVSVCQDFGVAHQQEILVLTRFKEPSVYIRQQILSALKTKLLLTND